MRVHLHQLLHGEIDNMGVAKRLYAMVLVGCILLVPALAWADDPVVQKPAYDLSRKIGIDIVVPTLNFSVFDKYTQHVGVSAGLSYFFDDYIGLEFEGGYNFINKDRSLLDEILTTGSETLKDIQRLPLSDLRRMTWFATAGLVFNPLYGKISVSSEFAVNIHLYLVAGAGVAGYQYTELRWTSDVYEKANVSAGIQPTYYFGGGLRFQIVEGWSLRFEMRDMFFYNSFSAQYKPSGTNIQEKSMTDFNHITMIRLAACIGF